MIITRQLVHESTLSISLSMKMSLHGKFNNSYLKKFSLIIE